MNGIGKRVTAGFLSIVALLFISGMISLFELGNLSNDTSSILSTSNRNMEMAKDLLRLAHDHSRAMMHVAVFGEHSHEDACRRTLDDMDGRLAAARSEAFNEDAIDSLVLAIGELRTLSERYLVAPVAAPAIPSQAGELPFDAVAAEEAVADASIDGKIWYDTQYEAAYLKLTEQIKHFMTLTYSSLAPRAVQLNKDAYRSVAPVFISLVVMIALVSMFFYFIYIYCVRPILKINKSLSDYLSFKLPYNVKTELVDEFKELDGNIDKLISISKQNRQQ